MVGEVDFYAALILAIKRAKRMAEYEDDGADHAALKILTWFAEQASDDDIPVDRLYYSGLDDCAQILLRDSGQ